MMRRPGGPPARTTNVVIGTDRFVASQHLQRGLVDMHEHRGEQFLAQQVDQRHDLLTAYRIDPGAKGCPDLSSSGSGSGPD